jgi:hypothetical protein
MEDVELTRPAVGTGDSSNCSHVISNGINTKNIGVTLDG